MITVTDVLRDVASLLQKVEAQELERYVQEIDKKYSGFAKKYDDSGFILTKERKEILNSIQARAKKGDLNLFVLLAAFGFGKSILLNELNNMLFSDKIKFIDRSITSVQLRLNIHNTIPRIFKEIFKTLLGTDENQINNAVDLIYEESKKLPLIEPLPKQEAKERIRNSLMKGALDLDLLVKRLTNTELIELIEGTIRAYESGTNSKVVFIVDEIEHTREESAFPPETRQFLALLTRNFYEREKENFVGIIAAAPEPGIEIPILRILGERRKDIIDRVIQKGIGREIRLDVETAVELLQRILRFYLYSLLDISGCDQSLKGRLDKAYTRDNQEYTYPISRSLLEYLAQRGLAKTTEGFIYDFRSYLILVGDIINTWTEMIPPQKLLEEITDKTCHGLTITGFWQPSLNKEVRKKSLTRSKIGLRGISPTIFLDDVEKFVEDVCGEVKEEDIEIIDTIKWIVKQALESNDEKFRQYDKQIMKARGIPPTRWGDFRTKLNETIGRISNRDYRFIDYSWDLIRVSLDKLEQETVRRIKPPERPSIFYDILRDSVNGMPVRDIEFCDMLEKCIKEEKLGKEQVSWIAEKEGEREYLFYDLRNQSWGSRIFVTKNLNDAQFIRRKIKESNRFDKGLIINVNEDKFVAILPNGLKGLESEINDSILMKRGPKIRQSKQYQEIYGQINEVIPDLPEHRKYYFITLILPYYFRFKDILKDEPSQLPYCYLWNEILYELKKKKLERDWIAVRTGLEIVKDVGFKGFASTVLKVIIAYGNKADLQEHDPSKLRASTKIAEYGPTIDGLGLQRIWDLRILAKSELQKYLTKKGYAQLFDGFKIKDETYLVPKIRDFFKWIEKNLKKEGKISLNDVSNHLFGVKIERGVELSWNITMEGKLSALFLLFLGYYYGNYSIRLKERQIWAVETSTDAEMLLNTSKDALMEKIEQVIISEVLKQKVDVTDVLHLWRMYTSATRYKDAEKKLKAAQNLQNKIGAVSTIEIVFAFSKVLTSLKALLKNSTIRNEFTKVGEYLRELQNCMEAQAQAEIIMAKRIESLIDNLQMQVKGYEEARRCNEVIKSLGEYTEQPKEVRKTDFFEELQNLGKQLEEEFGQRNWSKALLEKCKEKLKDDCLRSLQKEKVYHTSIDSYLSSRILSERIPDYSEDERAVIKTKIDALVKRFKHLRQENKERLLAAEQEIKKCAMGDFKEQADVLIVRIQKNLSVIDRLDPEKTSVETVLTEVDKTVSECNMLKNKLAIAIGPIVDDEVKSLLEKSAEVNYNINNLCKNEFGLSLSNLILGTMQGHKTEKKALEKVAKLLMVGEKIHVTFEV